MRGFFAGAALAASVLFANAASAQSYDFSFTGTDVSGSGHISTIDGSDGSPIASVTGTIFDSEVGPGAFTITTLSNYAGADNLYHTTSPFADFGGISFNTNSGGAFNIGGGGSGPGGLVLNAALLNPLGVPGVTGSTNIIATSSAAGAVPEPATWAMMITGFGMIGFGLRRRSKVSTNVSFA